MGGGGWACGGRAGRRRAAGRGPRRAGDGGRTTDGQRAETPETASEPHSM